jgi:N-acetylmuramic acid 6-phosphate etherase
MVKVQLKNSKLIDRGRRIASDATGCTIEQAATALQAASNDVRIAILIVKHRLSPEDAERHLAAAGDNLWKALETPP